MDSAQARRILAAPSGLWTRDLDFDGLALSSVGVNQFSAWYQRCSFRGTDLRQATLDRAFFKFCDFSGADLRGASLRRTSLSGCVLRGCDLRGADLTGIRLGRVNTGDPIHGRTDLTDARLDGAILRHAEFTDVIGWLA